MGVGNPGIKRAGLAEHTVHRGGGVGVDFYGNGAVWQHGRQFLAQRLVEIVDGRAAELVAIDLVGLRFGVFGQKARIGGLAVEKTQGGHDRAGFLGIGPVEKNTGFEILGSHMGLAARV